MKTREVVMIASVLLLGFLVAGVVAFFVSDWALTLRC